MAVPKSKVSTWDYKLLQSPYKLVGRNSYGRVRRTQLPSQYWLNEASVSSLLCANDLKILIEVWRIENARYFLYNCSRRIWGFYLE
jgi:hypothetical protein